jgi:hypothetical protein
MGTYTETAKLITVYRLPTKKNKLPFSVSVCFKQMEVCRFRLFAANKRKLPLSVFHFQKYRNYIQYFGDIETWKHGDMETLRHRDMGTRRHGDMETWGHGDIAAREHGDTGLGNMGTLGHGDMET